uniref:Ig-like domain-containing protein n=1 Tax=Amphimedon queenslandica TaxID=400682 RepID=A0A1X7V0S3_AMPQE
MEPKSCLIFLIVLCAVTAVSCSKNKIGPRFHHPNATHIRLVNSGITLSCALREKTNPPSKVTFSTTVKETSNVDWLPEHRLIKVHNAVVHNSGNYYCTASNANGNVTLWYVLDIGYPVNETVQGYLSYSPGIFTTNYTYLTPHDQSVSRYRVFLIRLYPILKPVAWTNYYNTTLPPTESFNVTFVTSERYFFIAFATNKYTNLTLVKACFNINEEIDMVYWKKWKC